MFLDETMACWELTKLSMLWKKGVCIFFHCNNSILNHFYDQTLLYKY